MKDIRSKLVRITAFLSPDSEFLQTCLSRTSQSIPELRQQIPDELNIPPDQSAIFKFFTRQR